RARDPSEPPGPLHRLHQTVGGPSVVQAVVRVLSHRSGQRAISKQTADFVADPVGCSRGRWNLPPTAASYEELARREVPSRRTRPAFPVMRSAPHDPPESPPRPCLYRLPSRRLVGPEIEPTALQEILPAPDERGLAS